MTPEMCQSVFTTTVTRCLNFPFSTVVLQENGQLAACLLASVWNRKDPLNNADFDSEGVPENLRLFVKFINDAHSNFWKIAPPGTNSVIHREIGSVAPEFTRLGIATKMVTTNLTKTNLKCLKELPYSAIVDSNGNEVLKLDDGTTALRLNFKPIEEFENLPD
uniref:N-acetyltransferase domain-containing protein n=1 Tax=Caenorhabditis tropicalis TaxID=1561998 RepID=A0A1I7V4B2_9PELO